MNTYYYNQLTDSEIQELIKRPKMDFASIFELVQPIIDEVETNGDNALRTYTKQFDGVELSTVTFDPNSVNVALDPKVKAAIDQAFSNIEAFHKAQLKEELQIETMPGVTCKKVMRPIESVGIYVPGGTAILPSTAMMLSIPAIIAGCSNIVLASPPNKDGVIAPEIVYIAQKAGVSQILMAGGAQAVAAMAFGTESVTKVDKILGPGNQYVTAAKMILQNSEAQISMDMPAGPSEVLVIADGAANPAYVAADLLSQAEHGADSQVVLVATQDFEMDSLKKELDAQLEELPRKEVTEKALENSFSIIVDSVNAGIHFSNIYAPEHLIVNVKESESYQNQITNAGSVFFGQFTPESVGDYASGTNHTLPTYGYARMYSGVNLASFQKSVTMQTLTREGIRTIGPTVEVLAELEGLQAHKNAVSIRLKDLE
ncbi:MAG: histidinol dehydrogenase [Balneolales bacterium]|nr:histidinol dehydrogenase [Balneolales bacterium]